ncbi:MAG: hypothetical protein U0798_00410 [Gemmataceae bacterium]
MSRGIAEGNAGGGQGHGIRAGRGAAGSDCRIEGRESRVDATRHGPGQAESGQAGSPRQAGRTTRLIESEEAEPPPQRRWGVSFPRS